ncbi:hypothetical protein pb186bvf_011114 [Paramecium bursaria]
MNNIRIQSSKSVSKTKFLLRKAYRHTEKESLEDTITKLRMDINRLMDENKKIKLENQHLQKQISKQEKCLQLTSQKLKTEEKLTTDDNQYLKFYTEETQSSILYIRQIKQLEHEIKLRDQQLEDIKKDIRKTKLQEVQIEARLFKEQYESLLTAYKVLKNQESKNKDQVFKENIYLTTQLLEVSEQLTQFKMKNKKIQFELNQTLYQKKILEKQIEDKEKDIQLVQFEFSNPRKTIGDLTKQYTSQIDQLQNIINDRQQDLDRAIERQKKLESQLTDLQQNHALKETFMKKEIENLSIQVEQLKRTIINMEQEQSKDEISVEQIPSNVDVKTKKSISKKKVNKVYMIDISQYCLELQISLKLQMIKFQDLERYIYNISSKGTVQLQDVIDLLQKPPFEQRYEIATLISRYLVEPETDDTIYYDPQASQESIIVISRFKSIIKNYELIPSEEYEQLFSQIRMSIKGELGKVSDFLNLNGDKCDYDGFLKALDYCDVKLTPKQTQYLAMKIYEKFQKLEQIQHAQIITLLK